MIGPFYVNRKFKLGYGYFNVSVLFDEHHISAKSNVHSRLGTSLVAHMDALIL